MQRGEVSVLLTDAAASDVASIYRGVLEEAGLDAADSFYAQLRTAIERIGRSPKAPRDHVRSGYRVAVVDADPTPPAVDCRRVRTAVLERVA